MTRKRVQTAPWNRHKREFVAAMNALIAAKAADRAAAASKMSAAVAATADAMEKTTEPYVHPLEKPDHPVNMAGELIQQNLNRLSDIITKPVGDSIGSVTKASLSGRDLAKATLAVSRSLEPVKTQLTDDEASTLRRMHPEHYDKNKVPSIESQFRSMNFYGGGEAQKFEPAATDDVVKAITKTETALKELPPIVQNAIFKIKKHGYWVPQLSDFTMKELSDAVDSSFLSMNGDAVDLSKSDPLVKAALKSIAETEHAIKDAGSEWRERYATTHSRNPDVSDKRFWEYHFAITIK